MRRYGETLRGEGCAHCFDCRGRFMVKVYVFQIVSDMSNCVLNLTTKLYLNTTGKNPQEPL